MRYLIESFFDIAYLGVIIALGFRLIFENNNKAKEFGLMSIILGLGDSFHLVPRIISNLTVNGFDKYVSLLSWGEFVTSITMTLFYIFFYGYYITLSGDNDRKKTMIIYFLAIIRVILVCLPQNLWGTKGSYIFGILRNIPFAIMGIFLIIWTWKYRKKEGFNNISILIAASFLFYTPVVVGVRFVPILGAFMIPKTIAYVLIVVTGFKFFIRDFKLENILKDSATLLAMGLIGGVFYREFTKLFKWNTFTTLNIVHTHLITLGFILLLVIYAIMQNEGKRVVELKIPLRVYIIGLSWTVVSFIVRGVYSITSPQKELFSDTALSSIAGLGHIILGIGMILIILKLIKIKTETKIIKVG